MNRRGWLLVVAGVLLASACGGGAPPNVSSLHAAIARRTTMWLGSQGLDEDTAVRLREAGIDTVVVQRGRVDLASGVPVLKLGGDVPRTGVLPVGLELTVERLPAELNPSAAEALWRAIEGDLGAATPAELILDLRELSPDLGAFIAALAEVSGAPVVPVLTVEQLASDEGRDAARAARTCIVPAYGSIERYRPGASESSDPLATRLEGIANLGVRVRVGIVLMPQSIPELGVWGDDLDRICGQETTEIAWT